LIAKPAAGFLDAPLTEANYTQLIIGRQWKNVCFATGESAETFHGIVLSLIRFD
jgi:hypothetical protein